MPTMGVFRASVGGYVGSGHVHPALIDAAREGLAKAKESGRVIDGYVARSGDGIGLVVLHDLPPDSSSMAAWVDDVFGAAAAIALRLHQHGTNGQPPAVEGAEVSLQPRSSEPVVCFVSNGTAPGSWNIPLYRAFGDPFNTPGLVSDPVLGQGFSFLVSCASGMDEVFVLPEDAYRLLGAEGSVTTVISRASGDTAAVASMGSDPVLLVRCGGSFPSVEDVLECFAVPALGAGPTDPIVPVSANTDASSRSLSRAVGLGFQVAPDRLVGPRDLFGDSAFDEPRRRALAAAELMRPRVLASSRSKHGRVLTG